MAVIYALLRVRLNNVQNVFVHQKSNHRRNRHYFSANGPFLLLPLALKWGLFGTFGVMAFLYTPLMITPKTVVAAEVPYITLTVPSSPFNLTVSPDNTLAETSSTDSAKITVSGNTYWGYTLSLTGGTDDGSLTDADSNKLATFSDNGTITTNTWGYKFKKQDAPNHGDNKWLPGPKKDALTMLDTTAGNGDGTSKQEQSTYEFTLGAKVDARQPAGQYHNTFTFTATVNAVSYTINYDNNDGDGGPGKVTSQTQEKSVKLSGVEPTRSGEHDYVFLGWCDRQVSEDGTCDGAIYQPNNDYEIKAANQNTTLYAMWDWITMQNWDDCSKNLVKNKQFTLVDSRDSRAYYVAKLADENCWMTENLDLFLDKSKPLMPEDSDVKESWTPPTTYKDNTWDTSTTGLTTPQSYDPGDFCWKGERSWISSTPPGTHFPEDSRACDAHDQSHYHIGNYYNYSVAVAQDDTSNHSKDGEVYDTSICPKGWQLPNSSEGKSYLNLYNIANSSEKPMKSGYIGTATSGQSSNNKSTVHMDPYYLPYSGTWNAGLKLFGVDFGAWTNTIVSETAAYQIRFNGGGWISARHNLDNRGLGLSVRCVARQ